MFWRMTIATLVAYPVTFAVVRLLGKKQVSSMTYWDVVSSIALGSLAANIITNERVGLLSSAWVVMLWGGLAILTGWAAMKNRTLRDVVQGVPKVVIANGKIMEQALREERMNTELLLAELRAQGVSSIHSVEFAILEPTGKLSVIKKSQSRPVTPADLHLPTTYQGLATTLVSEGRVLEDNLRRVGLSRQWLTRALAAQGVNDLDALFYAELGTDGTLYVDRTQDRPDRSWQQH